MIDRDLASFIHEGLGIHVGTRNARLEPNGARALAVVVDDDGAPIGIVTDRVAAARVLPDLKSNGFAAVTVGRPVDERACQVKGTFVSARAAKIGERDELLRQFEGFRNQLQAIGIPRDGSSQWITWPAVAIRLKATAVFNQTPGADAGKQIA